MHTSKPALSETRARASIALLLGTVIASHPAWATTVSGLATGSNGKSYLQVDGNPYLVIGAELRLDLMLSGSDYGGCPADIWTISKQQAVGLFPVIASWGFNTVTVPILWKDYEATGEGNYSNGHARLAWLKSAADAAGIRLLLAWYGSNVDGQGDTGCYSPPYVSTYTQRIAIDGGSCKASANGFAVSFTVDGVDGGTPLGAEQAALTDVDAWLAANDKLPDGGTSRHTFIGMQVENEAFIFTSQQCNDISWDATTVAAFNAWATANHLGCSGAGCALPDRQLFARQQLAKYVNQVATPLKFGANSLFTYTNLGDAWGAAPLVEAQYQSFAMPACSEPNGSPASCNLDVVGIDPYTADLPWLDNWLRDFTRPPTRFLSENGAYGLGSGNQDRFDGGLPQIRDPSGRWWYRDSGAFREMLWSGINQGTQTAELPRLVLDALYADGIGYMTYEVADDWTLQGLMPSDAGYAFPITAFSRPVLSTLSAIAPALASRKAGVDAFYFGLHFYPQPSGSEVHVINGWPVSVSYQDTLGTDNMYRAMTVAMTDTNALYVVALGADTKVQITNPSGACPQVNTGTFTASGQWVNGASLGCTYSGGVSTINLAPATVARAYWPSGMGTGAYKSTTVLTNDPMLQVATSYVGGSSYDAGSTFDSSFIAIDGGLHLFTGDPDWHLREVYWQPNGTGRLYYDWSADPQVVSDNGGKVAIPQLSAVPSSASNGSDVHVFVQGGGQGFGEGDLWEFYSATPGSARHLYDKTHDFGGPQIVSNPAAVVGGDGTLRVYALANDTTLVGYIWPNTLYRTTDQCSGDPSAAHDANSVHVMVRRTGDNHLLEHYCPNGGTCTIYDQTGSDSTKTLSSSPVAVITPKGTMHAFGLHYDSGLACNVLNLWNWETGVPAFRYNVTNGTCFDPASRLALAADSGSSLHLLALQPNGAVIEVYLLDGGATPVQTNLSTYPGGWYGLSGTAPAIDASGPARAYFRNGENLVEVTW